MGKQIRIYLILFLSLCLSNFAVAQTFEDVKRQLRERADSCMKNKNEKEECKCLEKTLSEYESIYGKDSELIPKYIKERYKSLKKQLHRKGLKTETTTIRDTVIVRDTIKVDNIIENVIIDTIIHEKQKIIYIMPEPNLCHPLGIKSWEMDKNKWKWTSIGIGSTGAIVSSVLFFKADCDNLKKHKRAETYTDSQNYYKKYKDNHQLNTIWGPMISMAGGALLSYGLYNWNSSVYRLPKETDISPYVDTQGNWGLSGSINF